MSILGQLQDGEASRYSLLLSHIPHVPPGGTPSSPHLEAPRLIPHHLPLEVRVRHGHSREHHEGEQKPVVVLEGLAVLPLIVTNHCSQGESPAMQGRVKQAGRQARTKGGNDLAMNHR